MHFLENNFIEEKCTQFIEDLRHCCVKFKSQQSLVCDGIDIDKKPTKTPKTDENNRSSK